MSAYMIFLRDEPIRDPAAMEEYSRVAGAGMPKDIPFQPLVAYGALEALEGKAPDGIVVMRFENKADALAWYNSPGYQAAIPHRQRGADYRVTFVEGLD